ncbi:MAG: dockerin type I domain-containing protein, partial [Planctomycetota bacterium]
YTILSPDGANPAQRLHFAALYVEAFLGTFLPGDANGDGVVDLLDFDVLAQSFGQGPGFLGGPSGGDFNADGAVNLLDFDLLAQNFGASNPATIPSALPGALSGALPRALSGALPGAVPEPASAALLVLAGSLLARGRRRRRTA